MRLIPRRDKMHIRIHHNRRSRIRTRVSLLKARTQPASRMATANNLFVILGVVLGVAVLSAKKIMGVAEEGAGIAGCADVDALG